jgi:hypothetical protein
MIRPLKNDDFHTILASALLLISCKECRPNTQFPVALEQVFTAG